MLLKSCFLRLLGEIGEQTFSSSPHGVSDSRGPGDVPLPLVLLLLWLLIPSHRVVAL